VFFLESGPKPVDHDTLNYLGDAIPGLPKVLSTQYYRDLETSRSPEM